MSTPYLSGGQAAADKHEQDVRNQRVSLFKDEVCKTFTRGFDSPPRLQPEVVNSSTTYAAVRIHRTPESTADKTGENVAKRGVHGGQVGRTNGRTNPRAFRARWLRTGEECDAWPETKDVIGFARDGEEPFRSMPNADFWRYFERVNPGLFSL